MIAYTVTQNSSIFADKYLFKYTKTSTGPELGYVCVKCKGNFKYIGTYKSFITISQDSRGNQFQSTSFNYSDNGPTKCPSFICTIPGPPPSTQKIGGYMRCNAFTSYEFLGISNNGKITEISSYIACNNENQCPRFLYVRKLFDKPLTGTIGSLTSTTEFIESEVPTSTFVTTEGTDSFIIKNSKINQKTYKKQVFQQSTILKNSKRTIITEIEQVSTTAWRAIYALTDCDNEQVQFTEDTPAFIGGSAFYDVVIHLNDYHQYWYRTLNKTSKGVLKKTNVFKFGQRGSPNNKETDFTIKFIQAVGSSQFIYPYNCQSESFTYASELIKDQININTYSYFSTEALNLYQFGQVSKVEESYLSSTKNTIITKSYSSSKTNENLPVTSTTIVITKLQNINVGGLNYQTPIKSTESVKSHVLNKSNIFTHGECSSETDAKEITMYSNIGYKLINNHNQNYQTIFDRFNLGAVISPAKINNFYSNVILKNGNTAPIGSISFLKNLTIPIARLDSFINGFTSYDPSSPDGVNISYTTVTKDTSKGAQTRQITTVVTDFWTESGPINNETFLQDSFHLLDINNQSNILINYASNGNFNLGGVGEDGKQQVTRVYENGYYLKISNKFETIFVSKALAFSDSTNRVPLIPTYVVSTIADANGGDIYIKKLNLPLPNVIKILNGGSYEGDLFTSIWPLIYE